MIQSNDETLKLLEALESYVRRVIHKANNKIANHPSMDKPHYVLQIDRAHYILEQVKIHKRAIERGQLGWS
jgi:hypothetical protein